MEEIRRQGKLCDVTLKFSAHRIVLAASIPYFHAMFTSDMARANRTRSSCREWTPVKPPDGASFLQLQNVKEACCGFLQQRLHPRTSWRAFLRRDPHVHVSVRAANSFLQQNFVDVSESDEFLALSLEQLLELTGCDELNVRGEEQQIRLPLCRPQFLSDRVQQDQLLRCCHKCTPPLLPLSSARVCSSLSGLLYAVGGLSSTGETTQTNKQTHNTNCEDSLNLVEVYDPVANFWEPCQPMRTARSRVGVAVVNGLLYAIGGYDGQSRWNLVKSMSVSRSAAGVTVFEGLILVSGGHDGLQIFNTVSLVACGGRLFAVGGYDGQSNLNSTESFCPLTRQWSLCAPMSCHQGGVDVSCSSSAGRLTPPHTSPHGPVSSWSCSPHVLFSSWSCSPHGPVLLMVLFSSWSCSPHGPVLLMVLFSSWSCSPHGPVLLMVLFSSWSCLLMVLFSSWSCSPHGPVLLMVLFSSKLSFCLSPSLVQFQTNFRPGPETELFLLSQVWRWIRSGRGSGLDVDQVWRWIRSGRGSGLEVDQVWIRSGGGSGLDQVWTCIRSGSGPEVDQVWTGLDQVWTCIRSGSGPEVDQVWTWIRSGGGSGLDVDQVWIRSGGGSGLDVYQVWIRSGRVSGLDQVWTWIRSGSGLDVYQVWIRSGRGSGLDQVWTCIRSGSGPEVDQVWTWIRSGSGPEVDQVWTCIRSGSGLDVYQVWIRSGRGSGLDQVWTCIRSGSGPEVDQVWTWIRSGSGLDVDQVWIRSGRGSGPEVDQVWTCIRSGSGLDVYQVWIRSGGDQVWTWIRSGGGSGLDVDQVWIRSGGGSGLDVDQVRRWIRSGRGSGLDQVCASGERAQAPPPLQVRAELSDGRSLVLSRADEDLAWMMKKLVDGFPDDRDTLSNQLLSGLLRVRAAEKSPDPEFKVQEINKLLTTIVNLPSKFSQSEPVRTFFGLDQVLVLDPDSDSVKPGLTEESGSDPNQSTDLSQTLEQPRVQSPSPGSGSDPEQVFLRLRSRSDVLSCNGFCLANTETIVIDQSQRRDRRADQSERRSRRTDQWQRRDEDQSERGGVSRRTSTSCLGHAPHCGLSHLIGRVVKGRSLRRKKAQTS
ncbi:hypothetical protein WMY93_031648 [Mugilogobius chulae]|uniref:BACK domain-containing protein n=1 Tax=Mugilogobius chulae TaxID=88201 RepID=A0AAW0MH40_9GOBI